MMCARYPVHLHGRLLCAVFMQRPLRFFLLAASQSTPAVPGIKKERPAVRIPDKDGALEDIKRTGLSSIAKVTVKDQYGEELQRGFLSVLAITYKLQM